MAHKVESPAALGDRASRDALLLGGFERPEPSPNAGTPQRPTEARQCEGIARRHALAALCVGGALAVQQAALAAHFARRAVALMIGRRA